MMRTLRRLYRPVLEAALRHPVWVAHRGRAALRRIASSSPRESASEFMPPLNEGDLMFMPIADPSVSLAENTRDCRAAERRAAGVPRGRVRRRQGRARRHVHGSVAAQHDRNLVHLKPPAEWRAGMTLESTAGRHGSGRATARRDEHLDDADHQSHRHADDGHPVRGRRQGVRRGSDRARSAGASIGGRRPHRAGRRERLSRAADQRAVPQHHDRSAAAARYGLSVAADPGNHRVRDRRNAGRASRSRPPAIPGPRAVRRALPRQTRRDRRDARDVADRPADSAASRSRRSSPLAGPR